VRPRRQRRVEREADELLVPGQHVDAGAGTSTAARMTLTSSALSQSTGCARASSTSIAISPGIASAAGTIVSVSA
jgi:hypothetical protein